MITIKKKVEKAIENGKRIYSNPKSIRKLKELGVDVPDDSKLISWEDYISRIFSDPNKSKALERVKQLPPLPNIPLHAITLQYVEILKCIALGLNGAAISLSAILVEHMLKYAVYTVEMGGFKTNNPQKLDEIENVEFGNIVGRAAKNRLLSKIEKKALNEFREGVRNPYLHYNLKKITTSVVVKNVERVNLISGGTEIIDISAKDDRTIRPSAKKFVDEKNVLIVFRFANDVVKNLWEKIEHLQD